MSYRITKAGLEASVDSLNRIAGTPDSAWTKGKDGQYKANIGNYHLYWAYGSVGLHKMNNEGGVLTILGLSTKKDLYHQIHAYVNGMIEGVSQ